MLRYPSKQSQITRVINFVFNFILFPGLRNDDQTDTDPNRVIHDTNMAGNLNLSATSLGHKLNIYILLTDCYTFLLISVLRICYYINWIRS